MSDVTVRGRFIWHELLTTDTNAAESFYTKVVGWTTQSWPQNPDYTLFVTKAGPMAGMMLLPEEAKSMGAPPNWMSYIGTEDVDAAARQVTQLGGRVLRQPTDIQDVGRFAVVSDPQGAVFAIYTPTEAGPDNPKVELGDFSWHELATTDWKAALDFYAALFGWEKTEAMDMGDMGVYQMFGWKGRTLGGMFNKPSSMPGPAYWLPYAKVTDSKKAAASTTKLGGRVLNGPMEVPGGDWITMGMDPQGAVFAVHSAAASAAKPARKPAAKKATAKPAKKPAAKKATAKPAKKPAAKKAAAKPARRAASKKKAAAKPARKAAPKKKAAKKAAKKKAAPSRARKVARKAARKQAKRPARKAKVARRAAPQRKAAKKKGGAKKKRR